MKFIDGKNFLNMKGLVSEANKMIKSEIVLEEYVQSDNKADISMF